jgi:hypothetical protein
MIDKLLSAEKSQNDSIPQLSRCQISNARSKTLITSIRGLTSDLNYRSCDLGPGQWRSQKWPGWVVRDDWLLLGPLQVPLKDLNKELGPRKVWVFFLPKTICLGGLLLDVWGRCRRGSAERVHGWRNRTIVIAGTGVEFISFSLSVKGYALTKCTSA